MRNMWVLVGIWGLASACGGSSDGSIPDIDIDAAPPEIDAPPPPQTIHVGTLAGAAAAGAVDALGSEARFANPVNVVTAPDGTVYVADFDNGRIRAIDAAGNVTTAFTQEGFQRPFGLARGADGTLYVGTDNSATGGHSATSGTVWSVDPVAHTATVIATDLGRPRGLAVLPDGDLAVADYLHQVLLRIDPGTGATTVVAGAADVYDYVDGTGAEVRFSGIYGLATRPDGKVLVADYYNERLRLVDMATGETTTFAGTGEPGDADGPVAAASFRRPQALAVSADGDVYVADTGNFRIRRIRGGMVEAIAGDGTGGYLDHADARMAKLYGLEGLALTADGARLIFADGNRGEEVPYNRVRYLEL